MNMDVLAATQEITPQLVAWRREFHQHPERGLEEVWTPARIKEVLAELDIPVVEVGEGSLVGQIGQRGEKNLAIRADMDGLPVVEETGLPFAATNGHMHACGHDGHVTMLLGEAKLLKAAESQLHGAVYLCFQTAEEIGRGAQPIIDYLKEQGGVTEAIGYHLWADVASGTVSLKPGPVMAGADGFTITVHGVGGHGSRPDLAKDPIKPACQMVLELSALPSNVVSPLDSGVLHIGQITAGTAGNVFPDTAFIQGAIRHFDPQVRENLLAGIKRVVEHTAAAWDVEVDLDFLRGGLAVVNTEACVDEAVDVLDEMGDRLMGVQAPHILASENYSLFVHEFPGFLAHLGVEREGVEQFYHHHAKFDIDEDVLPLGVEFFVRYAMRMLG
jgi:amidohydrolase